MIRLHLIVENLHAWLGAFPVERTARLLAEHRALKEHTFGLMPRGG